MEYVFNSIESDSCSAEKLRQLVYFDFNSSPWYNAFPDTERCVRGSYHEISKNCRRKTSWYICRLSIRTKGRSSWRRWLLWGGVERRKVCHSVSYRHVWHWHCGYWSTHFRSIYCRGKDTCLMRKFPVDAPNRKLFKPWSALDFMVRKGNHVAMVGKSWWNTNPSDHA